MAIYDRIVSVAASEAFDFVVVLSRTLYAPPFKGRAPTTSPYIRLKRNRMPATMSKDIHANCPAYKIAKADTYKTLEEISLPQMAVASSSLSFLAAFKAYYAIELSEGNSIFTYLTRIIELCYPM